MGELCHISKAQWVLLAFSFKLELFLTISFCGSMIPPAQSLTSVQSHRFLSCPTCPSSSPCYGGSCPPLTARLMDDPFQLCTNVPRLITASLWVNNKTSQEYENKSTSLFVGFAALSIWKFWGVCLAPSRSRLSGVNSWVSCSHRLDSKLKLLFPCHEVLMLSFPFQIHHRAFMGILDPLNRLKQIKIRI